MTINEVSERFNIPLEILKEYESWELSCKENKMDGQWNYDDKDIEQISLIVTLREIGFTNDEIRKYMNIKLLGLEDCSECIRMLDKKRSVKLNEIHCCEKQLNDVDFLRHEMRKNTKK